MTEILLTGTLSLKSITQSIARPLCQHYNHYVSPSVSPSVRPYMPTIHYEVRNLYSRV